MPVHNALPHLDKAIESITRQSFSDFEFVILDDASDDGSSERLMAWAKREPRIRLIQSGERLGPVRSSNTVAAAARAPIVARMDADDISYPDRLRQQLAVFETDPTVVVVASLCDMIDSEGAIFRPPEAWRIFRHSPFVPFAHGAMMYRREVFERLGGYREQCVYWEDQDLVVRMAAKGRVMVIPRPLYQVRLWTKNTRIASDPDQLEQAIHKMYGATDRLGERRGYEDLLAAKQGSDKVDPRAFIALGCVKLWAGGRPRLFRRLLKRGQLSLDKRSASALIWAAWASASPSTLRHFMTFLLKVRNRASSRAAIGDAPVEWVPIERPASLASETPLASRNAEPAGATSDKVEAV